MASEVVTIGIPLGLLSVTGYAILREILAKVFEKRNENRSFTEKEHEGKCALIKQELQQGKQQFNEIRQDIKDMRKEIIDHISKLKGVK
jgi:hypothetical protein